MLYLFAFQGWSGPGYNLSNELYLPAVMIAAGDGFTVVDVDAVPELRTFFNYDTLHFDVASIPDDLPRRIPNETYELHRYLLYAVGAVWRVFGVSWNSIRVLSLFFLFVSSVLVYCISRLALPPFLSYIVAQAFSWNGAVLWTLHILRDFSKAPFVLCLALLLGVAIRTRLTARWYMRTAVLIGITLGIGMGFRRDMLALLPLALLVLATCRLRSMRIACLLRIAAAALAVFFFVICAFPVLIPFYSMRWTNGHDTVMGFSSRCDQEMGLIVPASYEKQYRLHDVYVTWQIWGAVRHNFSLSQSELEASEFRNEDERTNHVILSYILTIIRAFPADMLTRAYGAVARAISGVRSNFFPPFQLFHRFGLVFAIAGLAIIAWRDIYKASQVLLLLCLFCGYTSLQYGERHAFHTAFVPYWFGCLTFHSLFRLFSAKRTISYDGNRASLARLWRVGIWFVVVFGVFYIPLAFSRHLQYDRVARILTAYENAPRETLQHKSVCGWEGQTLITPLGMNSCAPCRGEPVFPHFNDYALVARFKSPPSSVSLIYEWDAVGWEFSGPVTLHTRPDIASGGVDYYFVVYETSHCDEWTRFAGLLLPDDQTVLFEGFQRLTDLDGLGLMFNLCVPDNPDAFAWSQRLRLPWPHTPIGDFQYPWPEPLHLLQEDQEIRRLLEAEKWMQAEESLNESLRRRPQSVHFQSLLVRMLLRQNNQEAAWRLIDDMIRNYPEEYALYH
ncbi:MAG TPA: hypothetical protein ENN29_05320, partial [Candidatus Hydrogenedentes bacterium]|nr:hypothetical protein [Candidatus Hydrogenedentota bacterium]